jgi:hypothetical protein
MIVTQIEAVFPRLAKLLDTIHTLEARMRAIKFLGLRETAPLAATHKESLAKCEHCGSDSEYSMHGWCSDCVLRLITAARNERMKFG